jgi:catechol 2,3-dioxygenase-like lactoylglutathione lyase family enzyme
LPRRGWQDFPVLALSQVIVAVPDLAAARTRYEGLGFAVVEGGRHTGMGTANCVIPLGGSYLELLGVVDPEQAMRTPFGLAVLRKVEEGERLARWSFRTDDVDTVAEEAGVVVEARSRVTPDGERLTWRSAGIAESLLASCRPFFMQWDDPTQFPGAIAVEHPNGATAIDELVVATEAPDDIVPWVERAGAPVTVVDGLCAIVSVSVRSESGDVVATIS